MSKIFPNVTFRSIQGSKSKGKSWNDFLQFFQFLRLEEFLYRKFTFCLAKSSIAIELFMDILHLVRISSIFYLVLIRSASTGKKTGHFELTWVDHVLWSYSIDILRITTLWLLETFHLLSRRTFCLCQMNFKLFFCRIWVTRTELYPEKLWENILLSEFFF